MVWVLIFDTRWLSRSTNVEASYRLNYSISMCDEKETGQKELKLIKSSMLSSWEFVNSQSEE